MSWVEKIKSGIIITTGDGKVYTPLYVINTKSFDFNIAEFEFPEIEGTLVKRSKAKGRRYPLELVFQGEDHLDQSAAFEFSARDERPWTISHPFYGIIIAQPESMSFDSTGLNITRISVPVIETITDDAPKISQDPASKIGQDIITQQETAAESFENDVIPEVEDINSMLQNILDAYNEGVKIISDNLDASKYFNAFNAANSAILNATSDVLGAINSAQAVLNAPALFKASIQARLGTLKNQFSKLGTSLGNLITPNSKSIYENNAGSMVMTVINTSIIPSDDTEYGNKTDVLAVIEIILGIYNEYIENLDTLQTDTGDEVDSYIPDFSSINELTSIVNFAVSELFTIALEAKQERIVLLEKDSNIINLTHRFYGLVEDDSTIDEFMRNNNIGLSEILQIKKDRKIIYYV